MINVIDDSRWNAIESGRIIKAFQDHVPGVFVRDYRFNGGWITIARGYITTYDKSMATDNFTRDLPAETLCCLPSGYMTRKSQYKDKVLIRPGWEQQMQRASKFLTPDQRSAIERSLGLPVFRSY